MELMTLFTMEATNWFDEDLPITYQFYFFAPKTISSSPTPTQSPYSTAPTLPTPPQVSRPSSQPSSQPSSSPSSQPIAKPTLQPTSIPTTFNGYHSASSSTRKKLSITEPDGSKMILRGRFVDMIQN